MTSPAPPTSPPNWAVRTVAVCLLAALGEVVLLAITYPDWQNFQPIDLAFIAFLIGPLVFLAVLAWRRRANPARCRSLFYFALVVGAVGLIAYGLAAYQFRSGNAEDRRNSLLNPTLVPLAQWLVVLAGWMRLNVIEKQEKRRRR